MNLKTLMSLALTAMISQTALAQGHADHYICRNLNDVEEYRVSIDLQKQTALFFDNDTESVLNLESTEVVNLPEPALYFNYTGEDKGAPGELLLKFNLTNKTVILYSLDDKNTVTLLGRANCEPGQI